MKELLKNEALFLMLEKVMGKKIGKDGIYKIQQAGQKYAGICYMDVADEFFYQCLSNTTSTVNDGALFKKIGVSENEDKLSNLINIEKVDIKNKVIGLNYPPSYAYYHKVGNIVILNIDIISGSLTNVPTGTIIYTFPEEIRPVSLLRFQQDMYGHKFYINTNGQLIYMTQPPAVDFSDRASYINESFCIL